MKRIISAIAALALAAGWATTASADGFTPIGYAPSSDIQAFTVEDLPNGAEWMSGIWNVNVPNPETAESPRFCMSLTTNGCSLDTNARVSGSSILPACVSQTLNCVQALKITKPDGTVVEAKMVKQFPGFSFDGVQTQNIPSGSTPSLWRAVGAPNDSASDEYIVTVNLGWYLSNGYARINGMTARVIPVKDVFGSSFVPSRVMYHTQEATGMFQSNHDNGERGGLDVCAATDYGYCAEKVGFTVGTRADLTLRISNQVTGWLHGRISKPNISVTPIDGSYNTLEIAGDPVTVPYLYAAVKVSEMPVWFRSQFIEKYNRIGGYNSRSQWWEHNSSDENSLELIPLLAKSANETAADTKSYWSVKSISAANNQSQCLSDTSRLIGLVTTNAMAYSGSAPNWDGASLDYKVAGLHYMPDGKTLVEGTYDLAIRSDVARCLYGFSNAPISATVSVIDASGETKSAVTTVNEVDGWLKLAAYGFTFSSPSIKVQLSQKATAAAPSSQTVQKTIVCVKGKLTKKVTGVAPKCPTGYKKKA
jgi:hypothetical protein